MALKINEKLLPGFFESGETLSTGSYVGNVLSAFITGGKKQIAFGLVLPKRIDNINSINITGLEIRARSVTGTYLLTGTSTWSNLITNMSSGGVALNQNCTSLTVTKATENTIRVLANFDGEIYDTNNVPVAVEFRNLGITFS